MAKVGEEATGNRIAHSYGLDIEGLVYAIAKGWLDEASVSREVFRFFSIEKYDLMRKLGFQSEKAFNGFMKILSYEISSVSDSWGDRRMSKNRF